MPLPVSPATEALASPILRLSRLGFFDFLGDPLRATDAPYDLTFGSIPSDPELDGDYFAVDGSVVEITPITHTRENSNTVSVTLSGLITLNSAMMTLLGNRTNWVGREAIIWYMLHSEDASAIGAPWRHYTGRMVNVQYAGDATSSLIKVSIENYLASLSEASNKTYLSQKEFDATDNSAVASLAAANSRTPGGSGVGSGSRRGEGGGRSGADEFPFIGNPFQ